MNRHSTIAFVTFIMMMPMTAGLAVGQAPASQPASETLLDPDWPANVRPFGLHTSTMTDDWFGLGESMRDLGIDMKFFWNHHYMAVLGGGLDTNSGGKTDATYDWLISLDLEKMGLIKDAEILVHAREQWGGSLGGNAQNSINRRTGSSQQVNDDADGTRPIHIDQLWYQQRFFDDRLMVKLGHLDYQTIIDTNVYANSEDKQFMNAALDNNPIIPVADQTGLGVAVTIQPCDVYSLILGIGDAQRDLYQTGFRTTFHDEAWFTSYMEHTLHLEIPTANGPLPGNYRFGMVYEPAPRSVFVEPGEDPDTRGNDYGFYASFDQMLLRENDKDSQGLGAFFRYGYRHGDMFRLNQYWSGGLAYTGLFPERDKDTMGFAIAQMISSKPYRGRINPEAGSETIYEWYYAVPITPWLVLTPDFQYIDNPNGTDRLSHAIAGGVRVRITF